MSKRKMPQFRLGDFIFPLYFAIPHTHKRQQVRQVDLHPADGQCCTVIGMEYVYIGRYVPDSGYKEDYEQAYLTDARRVLLYQVRSHKSCMTAPYQLVREEDVLASISHKVSPTLPIYPSGQKWSEEEKANAKRWFKSLEERGLLKRDEKGRFVKDER